ncbi:MAG: hypothetical protein PHS93_08495 [Candidatus Omnitrophica bacterium]|jgi:hypothetical protein|nr:hypothetical protein [Candidatus Neomarinimicrobiota bacterium]MDD5353182.1 hypothetical protein [Candidatus Omnitrophota bacterium]
MNDLTFSNQAALRDIQSGGGTGYNYEKDWTYYDELLIANAIATIRLFTAPLGGPGARNLSMTNMSLSSMIPSTQKLRIRNLKVAYISTAALGTAAVDTVYQMIRNTSIELQIINRPVDLQLSLWEVFGTSFLASVVPTVAGDNIPVINPRFHGILPLNSEIILPGNTTFELRVTHHVAPGAALVGDSLRFGLNGILEQVVG